jgi:hypothetical protein
LSYYNWDKNEDFLECAYQRFHNADIPIEKFFEQKQKRFLKTYSNAQEMYKEINPKKQLYLLYILNTVIFKNKWSWDRNWNFGVYNQENVEDCISIFENKNIFQRYNQQWRYNLGYNKTKGIWTQHNHDSQIDYFQQLINWAKKN